MRRKFFVSLLIGLVVAAICSLLFYFHFFDSWQLRLSDTLFTPRSPHPDIVIIAIDDKSIQAIGRWPWDRTVHAKLLSLLGTLPAVIGMDVAFPEPSIAVQDEALASAISRAAPVVLPLETNTLTPDKIVLISEYLKPIPLFQTLAQTGLVNMETDRDGITRQTPILIQTKTGETLRNFSQAILDLYFNKRQQKWSDSVPTVNGLLRINFAGKPGTFPVYSYSNVLSGAVSPDTFKDKIVLIGATALDLHDTLMTPVSQGAPMSGVEVHANVIQTILEGKYLHTETALNTLTTVVLLAIFASLIFASLGVFSGAFVLAGFMVAYIGYAIVSFDHGMIRNLIYPPLVILVLYVTHVIYKYLVENKQKRFIKKALSYYLSESVMREVLSSPKKLQLGGERKEITVLFSDVAGFTTISEKLPPEILAQLLNQYLTKMTNIVFTNVGVLDKYIGDAVMAFWGAPLTQKNHALLACKAAISMRAEIEKMKTEWQKVGIDDFDARIGINTGEMIVGNMGSDLRFDYTLLGDNVNLGSRLEGINKEYGTRTIISGSTYKQVQDHVIVRRLDTVAVKGKKQGVTIYELRGLGQPADPERLFLEQFETARKLYEAGKFRTAIKQFLAIGKSASGGNDSPTKLYISRCKELIKHPPKDWDGVFHAKSK